MKLISFYILFMAFCSSMVTGFVPMSAITKASIDRPTSLTKIFINIGDQERDKLTRDSEPGDYFKTNTDKMTDAEKLPIAIAGIAFITLPFLAGMIALYAAK